MKRENRDAISYLKNSVWWCASVAGCIVLLLGISIAHASENTSSTPPTLSLGLLVSAVETYTGTNISATSTVLNSAPMMVASSTLFIFDHTAQSTSTIAIGESGETNFSFDHEGIFTLSAAKDGFLSSLSFEIKVLPSPPLFGMHVRYNSSLVFNGSVTSTLRASVFDTQGVKHLVTVIPSVLTALIDADALSDAFAITKLDYYDAYKSFYLDCLTVEITTSTLACGKWNYVVDGKYPSVGMDAYPLKGGEQVYVYFGTPWNITASTSTFPVGATTTLSTWRYNYSSTTTEWLAEGEDTIDISVPNSASTGWWDTTITTTTLVSGADGRVEYVFFATGTYYAKITSPDFSKWSNSITLNVIDAPVAATSTATSTPFGGHDSGGGSGGGIGGGGSTQQVSFVSIEDAVKKILDFFTARQDTNGRVVDAGTTDWAIMSFAAHNQYAGDIAHSSSSLLQFIQNDTTLDNEVNVCAAYARRILALRAAGIVANDASVANRVTFLTTHCGAFGDKNLPEINDDIFVALALNVSGVDSESSIMKGLHDAILAVQDAVTGAFIAWGSPAPDMTGAAINMLKAFGVTADDNAAIARSVAYLHSTQLTDGGWNVWGATTDYITTAWVMMGISALGEGQSQWAATSGKTPWHVMTEKLNTQGYYKSPWDAEGIDWFGTKHAVPALLGRSWPIILAPKPQSAAHTSQTISVGGGGSNVNIGSGGTGNSSNTSTTSTSSILILAPLSILSFVSSTLPTEARASSTLVLSNTTEFDTMNRAWNETQDFSVMAFPPRRESVDEGITRKQQVSTRSNQSSQSQDRLSAPIETHPDPLLPLKKNIAQSAAAGSAAVFAGTSILLLLRLLLAAL